ncbi:MAG: EAL domain-containing protein [Burkholderiaceae bacterium]
MSRLLHHWSATGLLRWTAWALVSLLSLGAPAVAFVLGLQFERGTLVTSAGSRAYAVTQRIAENPQMWRFEGYRLADLLSRSVLASDQRDRRSIEAADGSAIAENQPAGALAWPAIREAMPLHDAGHVVGALVVERSMRPLLYRTAWVGAAALALGITLLVLLTRSPLRALQRAEAELKHKAFHDDLTGLHNREAFRRLLDDAIGRAQEAQAQLAVLYIDLDRFKHINDTLGHDAGDEVLVAVAQRLLSSVRSTDVVARLSGDEFAVLVDGLAGGAQAGEIADALLARFEQPFTVRGRDWHLSCSVGLSIYPQHACEADKLLAFADTAMLHAKSSGRSARSLYDERMQESVARRVDLEGDLRGALVRGEFELHYQPLVGLAGGDTIGAEALLRWRHPTRGLVPPLDFIAVLEETGMIHAVGAWVLEEACARMRDWLAAGLPLSRVAVNVSALQFAREAAFVEQVREALQRTGLPARHLQLELTEGVLMSDSERSLALLCELSALGVSLAIDDFGTGYSSLAYLRSFPVDTLKVDRSFVRDMCSDSKDASIVSAIVHMAHSLDLKVTAEGIERADQLAALTQLGCDTAQGYLLGRPMPAADFAARLAQPAAA